MTPCHQSPWHGLLQAHLVGCGCCDGQRFAGVAHLVQPRQRAVRLQQRLEGLGCMPVRQVPACTHEITSGILSLKSLQMQQRLEGLKACPSDSSPPAHTGSRHNCKIQTFQVLARMSTNCLPLCSRAVQLVCRLARCPQYACHSAATLAGCIEGSAPGSIARAVAAGDSGVPARDCFRRERTGGGYGDCRRVALGLGIRVQRPPC